MSGTESPATYEDLLALPEDERAEIIAGEVVTLPSGLPEHGWSQGWLFSLVGRPGRGGDGTGGDSGWWVLLELDVRLGPNEVVRPDLSGWRQERLPSPWGTRPIDVVPAWLCEVLSPSNASHDRVTKREGYARHGVPGCWVVDPAEASLEVLELVDGLWRQVGLHGPGEVVRLPPFEDVSLDLSELFVAAGQAGQ